MSAETPGFDLNKMDMDSEKKKKLSDKDLRLQVEREIYQREAIGRNYPGGPSAIRGDALKENLYRAHVDEEVAQARVNQQNMTPEEKEAMDKANQKVTEAHELNKGLK